MNKNKLASLMLLAVASQTAMADELNITLSKKQIYTGESVRAESVLNENAQTSAYIWLNENNDVLGRSSILRLSDELAAQSTTIRACGRQVLNDGQVLNGCTSAIEVNPMQYKVYDAKDNRPEAQDVKINGFLFIGNTVTASYTYFDADDDAEKPGSARFGWSYKAPKAGIDDWKPVPSDGKDLIIPESLEDGTVLEVDGLLKVTVKVTAGSGGTGGISSDPSSSDDYKIHTNYPGGNIADPYYRPLLTSETEVEEGPGEYYETGPDGEPDSAIPEDKYAFALLTQEQAVNECSTLGLQLVKDASEFATFMTNNSAVDGSVAEWPKHKMFWTNDLDENDPFQDFFGVAYADTSGVFEASAASPNGAGLVVCEPLDEE